MDEMHSVDSSNDMHLISRKTLRKFRAEAMNRWDAVTAAE
jgi:hypothetical protein